MKKIDQGRRKTRNQHPARSDGKIYFTKETERRVFFVMTLIMLIFGIMYRIGLF